MTYALNRLDKLVSHPIKRRQKSTSNPWYCLLRLGQDFECVDIVLIVIIIKVHKHLWTMHLSEKYTNICGHKGKSSLYTYICKNNGEEYLDINVSVLLTMHYVHKCFCTFRHYVHKCLFSFAIMFFLPLWSIICAYFSHLGSLTSEHNAENYADINDHTGKRNANICEYNGEKYANIGEHNGKKYANISENIVEK